MRIGKSISKGNCMRRRTTADKSQSTVKRNKSLTLLSLNVSLSSSSISVSLGVNSLSWRFSSILLTVSFSISQRVHMSMCLNLSPWKRSKCSASSSLISCFSIEAALNSQDPKVVTKPGTIAISPGKLRSFALWNVISRMLSKIKL